MAIEGFECKIHGWALGAEHSVGWSDWHAQTKGVYKSSAVAAGFDWLSRMMYCDSCNTDSVQESSFLTFGQCRVLLFSKMGVHYNFTYHNCSGTASQATPQGHNQCETEISWILLDHLKPKQHSLVGWICHHSLVTKWEKASEQIVNFQINPIQSSRSKMTTCSRRGSVQIPTERHSYFKLQCKRSLAWIWIDCNQSSQPKQPQINSKVRKSCRDLHLLSWQQLSIKIVFLSICL